MTSPPPLRYDTYYHIYNRGVNRGSIFFEERNCEYFLKLYEKHIAPVADTFAYCLLDNHFHVSVRVKAEDEIKTLRVFLPNGGQLKQGTSANRDQSQPRKPLGSEHYVSTQFSNFLNAYAKSINKAYQRTGSLFQHPFGRIPIKTDRQFWNVIAYIHQNPQKHGLVGDFREWKHSSYGLLSGSMPTFLRRDIVLAWFGGRKAYLDLHADWINDARSKWFAGDDI
jgi:hypothetical protein